MGVVVSLLLTITWMGDGSRFDVPQRWFSDLSRKLVLSSKQSGYPETKSSTMGKDKGLLR